MTSSGPSGPRPGKWARAGVHPRPVGSDVKTAAGRLALDERGEGARQGGDLPDDPDQDQDGDADDRVVEQPLDEDPGHLVATAVDRGPKDPVELDGRAEPEEKGAQGHEELTGDEGVRHA